MNIQATYAAQRAHNKHIAPSESSLDVAIEHQEVGKVAGVVGQTVPHLCVHDTSQAERAWLRATLKQKRSRLQIETKADDGNGIAVST